MNWGLLQTVLTIVFGITTIIALVVATRLARRKKPVWAYKTDKIIGIGSDAPPELKLTFNDKPVTDVFRTVFIFFNKGNQAIRKDDVNRVISVNFCEAEVLREPTFEVSKEEIGFSTRQAIRGQDSVVELDFSYLDHKDGAVVEVLHTKYKNIECKGIILEAGEPRYIGAFNTDRPQGLYATIVVFVAFAALLVWMWLDIVSGGDQNTIDWVGVVGAAVLTGMYIFGIISALIRPLVRYFQFPSWVRGKK